MDPSKLTGRDRLIHTIHTTPIIDHHAHPLLKLEAINRYPLLAITSEANGDAIHASLNSLAHHRGVSQLARLLHCGRTWEDVVAAIEHNRLEDYEGYTYACLSGIETVLVDDGLDSADDVQPFSAFSELLRSPSRRIIRIEHLAARIIEEQCLTDPHPNEDETAQTVFERVMESFTDAIEQAIADPMVAGFKSIICYRTGLAIPKTVDQSQVVKAFEGIYTQRSPEFKQGTFRLQHPGLNELIVHQTARLIRDGSAEHPKKGIQFHTGLGDNDITLTTASPSHLQEFIRAYPTVPIILLHSGYPFTRETGYLAAMYTNVYADIGEVFPYLSQDGQETVLREILDLCPWTKILWSTDGHWFPETYYLAVTQVREVLEKVLCDYVQRGQLYYVKAEAIVRDILFNNANRLYHLDLQFRPFENFNPHALTPKTDASLLEGFLADRFNYRPLHPAFLRIYWNDLTATPRVRVIPFGRVRALLDDGPFSIGITKASLGMLPNDILTPGVSATGEYRLHPDLSSLRDGPREGHISAWGEFREADGSRVALCPRSLLCRAVEAAAQHGLRFEVGFELEFVLMRRGRGHGTEYLPNDTDGHAWSVARALEPFPATSIVEVAIAELGLMGIHVEQYHAESAPGQYEIVLPRAPPVAAVETLLHAREVLSTIAAREGWRMTLLPKPYPGACGTAAHAHLSLAGPHGDGPAAYEPFYAGVLRHLRAVAAFTYASPASYERVVDGAWAGGRWVTWGTQNREAPLRRIAGSHWEVKCLDGTANPYLALAAVLAAGTRGVADGEALRWGDCEVDPAQLTENDRKELGVEEMLPLSLEEALAALKGDEAMVELMGEALVERYVAVKEAEIKFLETMNEDDRRQWLLERY